MQKFLLRPLKMTRSRRPSRGHAKMLNAVLLSAALLAIFCQPSLGQEQTKSVADDATKVVIATASPSFNAGFSNMWIGIPLGLYNPSLLPSVAGTQGSAQGLQLMLSGQVTMSTGVQDALLSAQAEGRTLPVVIPCVYLRGMIERISVLPDSSIQNIADLKGKTVGVPSFSNGVVNYLKFAAASTGMDPDAIHLVAVGDNQQAMAALTSHRIDALGNADVDVAQIQSLGVPLRVLPPPDQVKGAAVAYVFAFSRDWYNGHKPQAAALLQGMIKALIVMVENPEAAVRISYYMYPQSVPSGIPFDKAIANAVKVIRIRTPVVERKFGSDNRWCDFSPQAWSSYVDMLGLHGKADASTFYTDELISAINNFDEAKLRSWARSLQPPKDQSQMGVWLASLHVPQ